MRSGVAILTVAAFASAFLCVRWLLRYIASHDFTIFAWYRIVFGLVGVFVYLGGLASFLLVTLPLGSAGACCQAAERASFSAPRESPVRRLRK